MSELERQTRRERIEARLRECGWQIVLYDFKVSPSAYAGHAVREYPTESGPADYALFYKGQIIGIIEAKLLSLGSQNVLEQAQRYAKGVTDSPYHLSKAYHRSDTCPSCCWFDFGAQSSQWAS